MFKNIDCGYSLEPPWRGGPNEYHNLCFEQKYEKYQSFLYENFLFLKVKFSIYLDRRVFVTRNKEQTMTRHNSAGPNEYHNLCFEQKYEKYQGFLSENFLFLEVKFSIYLDRRVFVMRNKEQTMTRHNRAVAITHIKTKNWNRRMS